MSYRKIKISIIVPIYNAGKYLERCLNSLIRQTYKNIEIVLINDGSTDNSLDICEKFKEKDERIILINKINGGVSAARKYGLFAASGEYVTFVDADDYVSENMYEAMIGAILKEDCDIAESGYKFIDDNYNKLYEFKPHYEVINGRENCLNRYLENDNSEVFLWNKLYNKSLFFEQDLPEYKYSEDYLWNVILYSRAKRTVSINNSYYYYYKNDSGACNAANKYNDQIDGIHAGIYSYEYLNKNFPELRFYGIIYIINYCRFLYMAEYSLGIKDDDFYKRLHQFYKRYFDYVILKNVKLKKKIPGYLLFYLSPKTYARLNSLYHKIKEKTK